MRFITKLFLSLLLAVNATQFIACGSSSGDSDPTLEEIESALLSIYSEGDAFAALMSSFAKGYGLQQIVDGSLAGLLQANGDILDTAGGAVLAPDDAPVGTISARSIQVNVETRFLTISDNFLEEIGVDFRGTALTAPLELSEVGYSNTQILDGIDRRAVRENLNTGFLGILDDTQLEFILRAVDRRGVIDVASAPQIVTTDDQTANIPIGTEIDNSSDDDVDNNLSNEVLFSVSPTVIEGDHIVGLDPIPTSFGNFVITNDGNQPILFNVRPSNNALTISSDETFVLGGLQSEQVNVDFNGNTRLPFVSEIPVIGQLFRNNVAVGEQRTLIVLVTANIIDPVEQ